MKTPAYLPYSRYILFCPGTFWIYHVGLYETQLNSYPFDIQFKYGNSQSSTWSYPLVAAVNKHCYWNIIPRVGVQLEKLIVAQFVRKLPDFYGSRRLVTVSPNPGTGIYLSQLNLVTTQQTDSLRSIWILSSHLWLCLRPVLFPFIFSD
jgi:hypothetical protein